MSTKTLRKRIALATVVALGAGIFSATAAHAAITPVAGGTLSGTLGSATTTIYDNGTTGAGSATASIGLLAWDVSNGLQAQTATLLSTGKIAVGGYTASNTGTGSNPENITVTGGTIVAATATGLNSVTPTISGTSLAKATSAGTSGAAANTDRTILNAQIAPNAGVTSMSISIYDGATSTTPVANIVVTITPTSSYNKFSAAKSSVYWGDGSGDTVVDDATSANSNKADAGILAGTVNLKDAYGNALASASGLLTATASSGAVVNLGSASTPGSGNVAYSGGSGALSDAISFNVQQATAHAGWSGTVTFAVDGVVFATKSGTISGEVAKVKVTTAGFAGGVTTNASTTSPIATIDFYDAAGNYVYPTSGVTAVSSTLGTVVSSVSVVSGHYPTSSQLGVLQVIGSSKGVQKGLQVQYANASGSVITSNAFDIAIGGDPDTYTASWDKATYRRGEIATLTIKVVDTKGNPATAYTAFGGSTETPTVSNAPGAAVVSPAYGDVADSGLGIKQYKFVVSVDDGDYSAVISLPKLDKADGAAQTAAFSVASQGTSLNDVLKGIVSLIASINKQIAALAKLVTKKK
jgi:hypothetical protein